jgi:dTDP-4-amino-4,6-dideoxygalactose transaminase
MTCGEGGAVVTSDDLAIQRARCMIDPCGFYWQGREPSFDAFVSSGSRASEFEGAILREQLKRLPGLVDSLRRIKARVLSGAAETGLTPSPRNDPAGECATAVMYLLPTPAAAEAFAGAVGGTILLRTGRHTYTEWDPILARHGAHHPALNPFALPENAECRKQYSKDMCPRSLDILARTVLIGLRPDMTDQDVDGLISRIGAAAASVTDL